MKKLIAIALVLLSQVCFAAGDGYVKLEALFPFMTHVEGKGQPLRRLELPPQVLAQCGQDLSDIRLFDGAGNEVPYLLDEGVDGAGFIEMREEHPARLMNYRRTTEHGESKNIRVETYDISPPFKGGDWKLELRTTKRGFALEVTLRAVEEGKSEPYFVAAETFFHLTDPERSKLSLALPPLSPKTKRLILTLKGEEPGFLEPAFYFVSRKVLERQVPHAEALIIKSTSRVDGKTIIEVLRPRGQNITGLRLATSTGFFRRGVEIYDLGPGMAETLAASATLYRVEGNNSAERLGISLAGLKGEKLKIVIDDRESPPLEGIAVFGQMRRVRLIFSLAGSGTLRFGGGRAQPPQYDVESLKSALKIPNSGPLAQILNDPATFGEATLGPIAKNPGYNPSPVLEFAMHPGAKINPAAFTHRRTLEVAQSKDKLSLVKLGQDDVSLLRPDLGDLRIVDASSNQWPYLLERGAKERANLAVLGPIPGEGGSSYSLAIPNPPALISGVKLDIDRSFFSRSYTLEGIDYKGKKLILATGLLARSLGESKPLELTFSPLRLQSLALTIKDGDDAPLAITQAWADVTGTEVYFAAPPGNYQLLLGNDGATLAVYELAKARDLVLAVRSEPVAVGALEKNPAFSPSARLATDGGMQTTALWGALVLAVAILLGMTLRLVRQRQD